ncbi:MAG: methylcobalamin:coenzyme M methyltransferase [Syntrophorhabdus sp. PtaU1.Bin058]|nr:MAG: methylcobalamin:coenzyme M methyltransferase [Syntrophorhabdus sp. PtaU1.Bin058]
MRQEKMTWVERLDALRNGRSVDRVPFLSFILGFCAKNVGYPVASVYSDPERSLLAQMLTREQYGYDSEPFYGYASFGGSEFGGEIKLPDGEYEQAPSHVRFAVEKEQDVDRLELPDVKNAGVLPSAMKFSQLQIANGIEPSVVVGGAFTIAGNICVVDTLCRWVIKKQGLVHRLLRLATDHILDIARFWVDRFGKGRVNIQIWEPLASNQIISPRHFEKLVLPYQVELHEKLLAIGIKHILCHICGEQNQNLPYWSDVPMGKFGIISIGKEIDITTAIKYFGDRYVIAGNIEPAILQTGTPGEIYELCRQAIEKGKHAPKGFALMQGCEVPVNTPPYNLYTMKKAVDDFGYY